MFRTFRGVRAACLVSLLLALVCAAPASAALPSVGSGHRPGPDALYLPPPDDVPQLENAEPWRAEPLLVSGASAYRDGEFLYQDFLYDDHGAAGGRDDTDPFDPIEFTFAPAMGRVTYPKDAVFANNAADFVEVRVKPLPDATAFRVTLNTLLAPERTAFTIAIGSSEGALPWPHGAGVSSPAALFLTVHGGEAELRDAASGAVVAPAPSASVDRRRRQVDVRVPHAAWNPGRSTVPLRAGVGLWDAEAGQYLTPSVGRASEDRPGGGTPGGAALFNVAFRYDEPLPETGDARAGATLVDSGFIASARASWWRERAQAEALRLRDVSPFVAEVDFAKLADAVDDDSGVPRTGVLNRILASRHHFGQGVDHSRVCFDIRSPSGGAGTECEGRFVAQLQPYTVFVPDQPRPPRGFGLTLLLHSLAANHNQYSASRYQSQLGLRGGGSIVATPGGRGPDGFYMGIPEADTFEVWADVARRYAVDPSWTAVSGYSMGGIGTFRMLARWPDLFARGMSTVGMPGSVEDQLPSLRNTPIMSWAAAGDELVNIEETERAVAAMTEHRLRFIHDLFEGSDHMTLWTNDEFGPPAEFLGTHRVDRNPPHVTYVVDPAEDSAEARVVADHAYWLSGLRPRDPDADEPATIDARSEAFGRGDPPVGEVERSEGVLTGGTYGAMPYDRRERSWGDAPAAPRRDRLVVRAVNVASAVVDARRARLSCMPDIDLRSDGPIHLRIDCSGRAAAPGRPGAGSGRACARKYRLRLPRLRGRRIIGVRVRSRGRMIGRDRSWRLRRVTIRRPTRAAFRARVRMRTNRGGVITLTRRFPAC